MMRELGSPAAVPRADGVDTQPQGLLVAGSGDGPLAKGLLFVRKSRSIVPFSHGSPSGRRCFNSTADTSSRPKRAAFGYFTKRAAGVKGRSDKNFFAADAALRLVHGELPEGTRITTAGRGDGIGMQALSCISARSPMRARSGSNICTHRLAASIMRRRAMSAAGRTSSASTVSSALRWIAGDRLRGFSRCTALHLRLTWLCAFSNAGGSRGVTPMPMPWWRPSSGAP